MGFVTLTLGWQEEPAYAGLRNAVEVTVTDVRGAPVADPGASLRVDVSFGSAITTVAPSPTAAPGVYAAALVPTRAGTYTFRVHGSISGQSIDTTSTCSGQTFDCVVDVGEVQFPSRDPSPDELATRLDQGLPRAERAGSAATAARQVALAALGVAVLALAVAVGALAVKRGGRAG